MIFPVWVFNLHDSIVASLGFFCNILLIITVVRRTSPAFRNYGYMVLAYSINDTIYSVVSMTCRRVIELKHGSLFHMGYGLEQNAPQWLALFIEFLNEVVCMQATVIIPTQYYFRYILISKTREPTIKLLIGLTAFATLNSLIFGLSDIASNLDAASRGRQYYIRQLDSHWKTENGTIENFVSANDIQDFTTILHFSIGASLVFISYGIAMFYAYKTLKVVKLPFGTHTISRNTRNLTRQFTRNLFIQTAVTQFFAVFPSTYMAIYLVFRPNFSSAGPFTSSLFAWNPAANALVTLSVVRPYRAYVIHLLSFGQASKRNPLVQNSSSEAMGRKKYSTATTSNRYSIEITQNENGRLILENISPNYARISFARTNL